MADGSTRMAGDVMLRVMNGASAPYSTGAQTLDSQVQQLVSAMASFAPPASGQATCAANDQLITPPLLAVNGN